MTDNNDNNNNDNRKDDNRWNVWVIAGGTVARTQKVKTRVNLCNGKQEREKKHFYKCINLQSQQQQLDIKQQMSQPLHDLAADVCLSMRRQLGLISAGLFQNCLFWYLKCRHSRKEKIHSWKIAVVNILLKNKMKCCISPQHINSIIKIKAAIIEGTAHSVWLQTGELTVQQAAGALSQQIHAIFF